MIKIEQWRPDQWNEDKYSIIELEKRCFVEELQMSEWEIYEEVSNEDTLTIIARNDNNKIIGMTYGTEYNKTDKDWFDGYFDPRKFPKYDENKTLYITSTCVDPEYRGQEIAIQLRIELIELCRDKDYKYLVGHANEKTMVTIYNIFNGKEIARFDNWYDSGESHPLMEQYIEDLYINYIPKIIQDKDYNCGETSLKLVLDWKWLSNNDVWKKLNSTEELGVSHDEIVKFLTENMVEPNFITQYSASFNDLYNTVKIDESNPIVNYQVIGDDNDTEGHYSPIIGMSSTHIFIRDVWSGLIHRYSKEQFEEVWYSKLYGYRWYLVIFK